MNLRQILHSLRPLYKCYSDFVAKRIESKHIKQYLRVPKSKKERVVYLLGTPEHANIGDSAIALAERLFLCSCGIDPRNIIEIPALQYYRQKRTIRKYIRKSKCICLHGGGNMGDQWIWEEYLRRNIIAHTCNIPKIIFPQTIFYSNTDNGNKEKALSVAFYNNSDKILLVARDKISYKSMKEFYPCAEILLVPDIVLSCSMAQFGVCVQKRSGVLLCMRNDAERVLTEQQHAQIERCINELGLEYTVTDMHSHYQVTVQTREECVNMKMREFARASLVITDRLHGMVFAAITGTPCIVFRNYNHKVYGTYEWIDYLPYIKYIDRIEELENTAKSLLALENNKYDNTPLLPYFEKLADVIKNKYCIET